MVCFTEPIACILACGSHETKLQQIMATEARPRFVGDDDDDGVALDGDEDDGVDAIATTGIDAVSQVHAVMEIRWR